ncbi:L-ribulose-5-phosphate 4-epimerase [Enterocloster clostridioformis]|uniref:L-ribulose-5-phosphate 4-epimerase n=1 Tax=[Clostridium] clostridioforme 90A8 TaxID=999408 RepID=A0A0E2HN41_9FIRM|nr:L-ribulose-5-phosphate 4-epimerase [Enterocloster clostridioformis]ENZ13520.1 L-ribulose-5-phosphate 4-epimerase [[Clostridium] clostridioforme 90A8]
MLELLKQQVCESNLELVRRGVVIYTWGNVSGIDREKGLMVIKPSGVDYDRMCPEDMVVVDLNTGKAVEGKWKPSSDTATHLEIYRKFPAVGGVVHTHSVNAVAFAQAGMPIRALGTTHADYFYGDIPCTRELTEEEVMSAYEVNTGKVIIETMEGLDIDPMAVPGVLVKNHGPFAWGKNPANAVYNAVVLEKVAEMDLKTLALNPGASMKQYVLDKHYMRKHGPNSYYGQK